MDHETEYDNKKMKLSRKKQEVKGDDYVTIKIDNVDKTTSRHPNTIPGKIIDLKEIGNCAKVVANVVAKVGKDSTYVTTNRLNKCTKTNVHFNIQKKSHYQWHQS